MRRQRRRWPSRPACPRDRVVLAEDGVVVDLVDGRRDRSSARWTAATSSSTAPRSATSPSPRSRTAGSWARRGSSRSIVVVDSVTGKVVGGPEIHARGFVEDDAVFDEVAPADRGRPSTRRPREGVDDPYQLQQVDPPGRRPLGERHAPAPPDDHPGGPRGLSPGGRRTGRGYRLGGPEFSGLTYLPPLGICVIHGDVPRTRWAYLLGDHLVNRASRTLSAVLGTAALTVAAATSAGAATAAPATRTTLPAASRRGRTPLTGCPPRRGPPPSTSRSTCPGATPPPPSSWLRPSRPAAPAPPASS